MSFTRRNERVTSDDVHNLARAFRSKQPDRAVPVRALLITNRSFERGSQAGEHLTFDFFFETFDVLLLYLLTLVRKVFEHASHVFTYLGYSTIKTIFFLP